MPNSFSTYIKMKTRNSHKTNYHFINFFNSDYTVLCFATYKKNLYSQKFKLIVSKLNLSKF